MSVERIYYEQIKSFEETIKLIKDQIESSYQPLTRLENIKQIISQHDFTHKELYSSTSFGAERSLGIPEELSITKKGYKAKEISDKILEYQEKAKLYDKIFPNGNHEEVDKIVANNFEIVERLKDEIQEMKPPTSDDEFFNEKKFSFADTKEIFMMLLQSILKGNKI